MAVTRLSSSTGRAPAEAGRDSTPPSRPRPPSVAARAAVGVARERPAGQAVVAHRREELERVPPVAPRGCRPRRGFEDDEVAALPSEVPADGKTGLAAAHDDDLAPFGHITGHGG